MALTGNYLIQAGQARKLFLTYDPRLLAQKFRLPLDETYLSMDFLCRKTRIRLADGQIQILQSGKWQDCSTFEMTMTLLDLLCSSREHRSLAHRWKSMQDFGLQFHRSLLENTRDPEADRIQAHPERFRQACLALGGTAFTGGDLAFAIPLWDGLCVGIQFWFGDEEFPPRLRCLWDENALQYLHYETMYYAVSLILQRIREEADRT